MFAFWRWVFDLNVYADKFKLIKYISVSKKINPLVFWREITFDVRQHYESVKKVTDK